MMSPSSTPARAPRPGTVPPRLDRETTRVLSQEHAWPYWQRLAVIIPLWLGLHFGLHQLVFQWDLPDGIAGGAILLVLMAMGMLMAGMMVFFHELSHGHFLRHPTLNLLFGTLLSIPLLVPYALYGLAHQKHHAYNTTRADPSRFDRPKSAWVRGIAVLTHYTQMTFLMALFSVGGQVGGNDLRFKPSRVRIALAAVPFLVVLGWLWWEPVSWLWHLALPWLAFGFWNTTRAIGEHEYLYVGEDGHKRPLESTRSIRMGPWSRFFWWNAGYHIEHHLYPSLPFHHLPAVAKKLGLDTENRLTYWQYARYRWRRGVEYPMYF